MENLVAPCGLYCGPCPLYKAWHDHDFRSALAEKMKAPVERVQCPGCRPAAGKVTPIPEGCQTYNCAESKNLEYCHQCEDFPCPKLAPCSDRGQVLPHNIKIYSLLRLKLLGREVWENEYPLISSNYFRGKMVLGAGPKVDG